MLKNGEIAAALEELADLYELDEAVVYKPATYRKGARAVRDAPVSVAELSAAGRAQDLPGVGKTLAANIAALIETGDIPISKELRDKYPGELVRLKNVPGVGVKRARKLHIELGITTLDELRAAIETGTVRGLTGFGPAAEEKIKQGLDTLGDERGPVRLLMPEAVATAEQLVEALAATDAVSHAEVAGSMRRMAETIGDINIAFATTDAAAAYGEIANFPEVEQFECEGPAAAAILHNGTIVRFHCSPVESFGNLLQHLTGSVAHNRTLIEHAERTGVALALQPAGDQPRFADEPSLYRALGLDYIEPELREGHGEIELAEDGALPELIDYADVRGDLHCHTTASDGRNSIAEMAEAARSIGYEYLAITDHSESHGFGNHVGENELLLQIERVREVDALLPGFNLMIGTEANIKTDGTPDYRSEVLEQLDWVIASIHTSFKMSSADMTKRLVTAIEHPLVDAIGHPTGRLILRREPYGFDFDAVIEAAVRCGTMIEINANPDRRDLNENLARRAADAGVMLLIDSDAHRTRTLGLMRWGVATARRAGLTRNQVANTKSFEDFQALRKPTRTKTPRKGVKS